MRMFRWDTRSRLALASCLTAGALLLHTGIRAAVLEPLPQGDSARAIMPDAVASSAAPRATPDELNRLATLAVARNPFRADRSRSIRQPPASAEPEALPPSEFVEPSPAPPPVRLFGVAAQTGGGGLAAMALEGEPSRVLRIGDQIGDFRLISVSPGAVRLQGPDSTLVLRLTSPTQ